MPRSPRARLESYAGTLNECRIGCLKSHAALGVYRERFALLRAVRGGMANGFAILYRRGDRGLPFHRLTCSLRLPTPTRRAWAQTENDEFARAAAPPCDGRS